MNGNDNALAALYDAHRRLMEALGKLDRALALLEGAEDAEERRALAGVFAELGGVFRRELESHLVQEERHLFPVLERYLGREGGPVGVMLLEHEELRRRVGAYDRAVGAWGAAADRRGGATARAADVAPAADAATAERSAARDLAEAAGGLSALLAEHAHKEDAILFPMALRCLTDEELRAVAAALAGA